MQSKTCFASEWYDSKHGKQKNMVQILPVASGGITPIAMAGLQRCHCGSKKKMLLILLESFRVIVVLNHFEGL